MTYRDGLYQQQIPHEVDPESGLLTGPMMASGDPARHPQRVVLEGRYARLEPLTGDHARELFEASSPADAPAQFLHLFETAPTSLVDVEKWIDSVTSHDDPLFFAVIDKRTGRAEGRQALMRITPTHRCIEIGSVYWGPAIAGTAVSTEANFLFAQHVFEHLGYRRLEWKCNALNAASRRAALRLGFQYEGHFRRAVIVKGRSRDTSWFSMIDEDWPDLKDAYEQWLSPQNFDDQDQQQTRLSDLTKRLQAVQD